MQYLENFINYIIAGGWAICFEAVVYLKEIKDFDRMETNLKINKQTLFKFRISRFYSFERNIFCGIHS